MTPSEVGRLSGGVDLLRGRIYFRRTGGREILEPRKIQKRRWSLSRGEKDIGEKERISLATCGGKNHSLENWITLKEGKQEDLPPVVTEKRGE